MACSEQVLQAHLRRLKLSVLDAQIGQVFIDGLLVTIIPLVETCIHHLVLILVGPWSPLILIEGVFLAQVLQPASCWVLDFVSVWVFRVLLVNAQVMVVVVVVASIVLVDWWKLDAVIPVYVFFLESWAVIPVTQNAFCLRILRCILDCVVYFTVLVHDRWLFWLEWLRRPLLTRYMSLIGTLFFFHLLHDLSLKLFFIGLSVESGTWRALSSRASWKRFSVDLINKLTVLLSVLLTLSIRLNQVFLPWSLSNFKSFYFAS